MKLGTIARNSALLLLIEFTAGHLEGQERTKIPMSQRLSNAKVILYSDAGHAFLFQHAEEFGHEVLRFLR